MLTVVVPAASASAFKRPSLLNDASHNVGLTLEGPKPRFRARASLKNLNNVIKRSAVGGWLKRLDIKAESWDELRRWVVENWGIGVEAAVRRLGEGVRGELEALRDRLNDNKIAREVVAPALLLIQAEKLGVDETTLKYFGATTSGTIGGDGYVSAAMSVAGLSSGEREIAMLWRAVLAAHGFRTKESKVSGAFIVAASGVDAARLAGFYFLYGPPLLEEDEKVKSRKLYEAVQLGAKGLDIRWEGLRRTPGGLVAADLIISVGGAAVKYNVYLRGDAIGLQFQSTGRSRVELAARLLRLAGVGAEVRRVGDEWQVWATTGKLAAGHERLRRALAEVVEKARGNGWVDAGMAERWLEKLESGRVLKEGWPKYEVGLTDGALVVRFTSPNLDNIQREAQRLEKMGLKRGVHFSVKTPEEGRDGYVYIRREGLERAARLSVYGKEEQQRLAADFVEYILQKAEEAGEDVRKKAEEVVKEGKARGILKLEGFEKEVEVGGKTHVVKVIGGGAEVEEGESGKLLLRIRITAEVSGVQREYTITYGRYGKINAAIGYATARGDTPDGREEDAERLSALIKALTGKEPRIYRKKNGQIEVKCSKGHLEGFMSFAELADAIKKCLKKTSR